MAFVTVPPSLHGYARDLPVRIRTFVWAFAGMFSAACLAIAFLGYLWLGSLEQTSSNFVASLVSGGTFGLLSHPKLARREA